jgi:quercetin dioxygenase-like cupin family protein
MWQHGGGRTAMRLLTMPCLLLIAAAPPVTHQVYDVPGEYGPQQVIVQSRSFDPGESAGWHVHPGVEIATVISGTVDLVTKAGVRRLGPGDSFQMPRGTPHNGINPGSQPARVLVTLVIDKGAAPRQPVSAP